MAVSMLSGCSNGSDNSSTAQNSGEEPTGTITLKVAHNMDFVTIPDAVLAAGERLNEKYAAEGKDLKIEFETDYARIDWGEYSNNLIFAQKNGEGPDIFSVSDLSSLCLLYTSVPALDARKEFTYFHLWILRPGSILN